MSFLAILALGAAAAGADPLTAPIRGNPAWVEPQAPVRVHGQTYYVGTAGLSVALIDTGAGLVLVDGALPQTAGDVKRNIERLGLDWRKVRYILSTEPHHDHGGGLAALARDTGATVLASPAAAKALRRGQVFADDPQSGSLPNFPAVRRVREIRDGEVVQLGRTRIRAVFTPGHTPGSVSWTWNSCQGRDCRNVVFASSLNAVSADGYRFRDHPEVVAALRRSIARVAAMPCDILISAHPDNSGMAEKLQAPERFLTPGACKAYAVRAETRLAERLKGE
jgi:metallo-beta-lactamase class B